VSAPGRPEGEYRSTRHEGAPVTTLLDQDIRRLLDGLKSTGLPAPAVRHQVRQRLHQRVHEAAAASRAFVTLRRHQVPCLQLGAGVSLRTLYRGGTTQLRAGEAHRVRLVELAPGATWAPGDEAGAAGVPVVPVQQHEWLVMRGALSINGQLLRERDFHLDAAGANTQLQACANGALVYFRESRTGQPPPLAHTQRDAAALWHDLAPGIKRRVMWSAQGQAAMLYRALPGATVPHHGHGHDEECLVLEGELFLDDVLLRAEEFQLAPAGTLHGGVYTDVGALLYARGDLELALQPG
jgi:hypothetical protein